MYTFVYNEQNQSTVNHDFIYHIEIYYHKSILFYDSKFTCESRNDDLWNLTYIFNFGNNFSQMEL